jgi:hypothetical protein
MNSNLIGLRRSLVTNKVFTSKKSAKTFNSFLIKQYPADQKKNNHFI